MSLIDDLRKLGENFPTSHVPSPGELPGVVGALVSLIEQGPDLLKHLESDFETVAKFVSGAVDEVAAGAGTAGASGASAVQTAPAQTAGAPDHPASVSPDAAPSGEGADQVSSLQEQVRQLLAANQTLQEQITAMAAASRTTAPADASPASVKVPL